MSILCPAANNGEMRLTNQSIPEHLHIVDGSAERAIQLTLLMKIVDPDQQSLPLSLTGPKTKTLQRRDTLADDRKYHGWNWHWRQSTMVVDKRRGLIKSTQDAKLLVVLPFIVKISCTPEKINGGNKMCDIFETGAGR